MTRDILSGVTARRIAGMTDEQKVKLQALDDSDGVVRFEMQGADVFVQTGVADGTITPGGEWITDGG